MYYDAVKTFLSVVVAICCLAIAAFATTAPSPAIACTPDVIVGETTVIP